MPADRHEENARYWNKKKNDPDFMARRRAKNRLAAKRAREKRNRGPDERHVYSPDLDSLEERAAIKEFDAGKSREDAEEEALNEHLDYDPDFDFF